MPGFAETRSKLLIAATLLATIGITHAQEQGATSGTQQAGEIVAAAGDPAGWTDIGPKLEGLANERFYGIHAGPIKVGYMRVKLEKKQIGEVTCYKVEEAFHLIDPKVGDRGRIDSFFFKADPPYELMERANVETIGPKTVATTKEWLEGGEWVVERMVGERKIPAVRTASEPMLLAHKLAVELWAMRQPQVGDVMTTKVFDDASRLIEVESSIKRVADDGKGGKLYIVTVKTPKMGDQDFTVTEKGEVLEVRSDRLVTRVEPAAQAQDLTATRELLLRMPAQ